MNEAVIEMSKVVGGFLAGAATIAVAYVKGWWGAKTPEAQKRFLKVVGKAFADGKISEEEYRAILDEL